MRKQLLAMSLLLSVFLIGTVQADVTLPKIFGSHMVLQQEKPIVIWGWAKPGEKVKASIGESTASTTATDKGEWKLSLPAIKAGGPAVTLTITGANTITFDDVLIGEVWLCSGQSNMEFGIGNVINAEKEIAAADYPQIRLMKVDKSWKPSPQIDLGGEWKVCTPETVKQGGWNGFSAVGYFFGRELHQTLKVPVGLIDATWGGTRIESWTPPQGFAQVPALSTDNEKLQMAIPGSPVHDQRMSQLITEMTAWNESAQKSVADKTMCPPMPKFPAELLGPSDVQSATALFNGMIHPLVPFAMRGAIWYQGEANHNEGKLYTERMKALIGGWRTIWNEGEFPFYFVQIAPYNYGDRQPYVPEFWEAQELAEKTIPNTGMIVVNDIGNLGDIHPKNKQDVGHRLAVRALHQTYGMTQILGSSPMFKSLTTEGDKLRITFDNTGDGLKTTDGKPVRLFEIAGETSGGFKPATAVIDGGSVVLSSSDVKSPTAVRFAWAMLAEPNLCNSASLPASAFRAGDIPVHDYITEKVPEVKNFKLVYDLDLSKLGSNIQYTADNHASITGAFDRIAYAMELQDSKGNTQWVYASMDAFTDDIAKAGVPTAASHAHFQQNLSHLTVMTNVAGITTGENLDGGNIEFWPNNYAPGNAANVPGASSETFDFGDQTVDPVDGYGSMQIHNHNAKQTLFALNHWREGTSADIGIGNAPTGNPDWTFAQNAESYPTKRLRVFVRMK